MLTSFNMCPQMSGCNEICSSNSKGCLKKNALSYLFLLHVDTFPQSRNIKSKIGNQSTEASGHVTEMSKACQSAGTGEQGAEQHRGGQLNAGEGQQGTEIDLQQLQIVIVQPNCALV